MVDGIVNLPRSHRRPVAALRSLAALLAAALVAATLAACGEESDAAGSDDQSGIGDGEGGSDDGAGDVSGDGDGGGDAPPASDGDYVCSMVEDCVVVSSTCCGCPDFAVRADSDYADACEDVECEPPTDCPRVVADCAESSCVLVCEPIAATHECPNGFARDAIGCLVDACRTDPPDPVVACEEDVDCVQVQADCCGCLDGGADTAVNADHREAYLESLACRDDAACPGVNVCDASQEPVCVAGGCTLSPSEVDGGDGDDGSGGDGPPEAEVLCGASDLPPCPTDQVCVLNYQDAEDATRIGVGVCRPGA